MTGVHKRGRPPVGSPIHIRLGAELVKRIDNEAEFFGESRARTIRRLLNLALERLELERLELERETD
jgi:hypothetical protein